MNKKKLPSLSSIPFHKHSFGKEEIQQITKVLKSTWITGGPETEFFEEKLRFFLGSQQVLTVQSATAGLFLALKTFSVGPGDEVITSPYSFVATANVIMQCGAKVVFADISDNYLLNPEKIYPLINRKTKAIIPVDYGGYPCDYQKILEILEKKRKKFQPQNLFQESLGRPLILADSAHSLGTIPISSDTTYSADVHCYSLHAVKNITTAEGGVLHITNPSLQTNFFHHLKLARCHGIDKNAYQRQEQKEFFYDMKVMGYKFNLTELQAALGIVQLKKIHSLREKKLRLEKKYLQAFASRKQLQIRKPQPHEKKWHVHPHLFTLEASKLTPEKSDLSTNDKKELMRKKFDFFTAVKNKGVELNFHYQPIPLMSFYRNLGYTLDQLEETTNIFPRHFSLPFYADLQEEEIDKVINILIEEIDRL